MCLAVPMKLILVREDGTGLCELGDVTCEVDLSLVERRTVGDYVIVHTGYAIELLDVAEAEARLAAFEELRRAEEEST